MSETRVVTALAKVMIAAAWADGGIDNEELNCLKDLLFRMPHMTAGDWAHIEIYLATPIEQAERQRLVADLQDSLRSKRDQALALEAIDALVNADGKVTAQEADFAAEIKQAVEQARTSLFGQLGKLARGAAGRRSRIAEGGPNRERHLTDFVRNRVFYLMRERLGREDLQFDLSEAELRKLSLAGGLMAQVGYADRSIDDAEISAIGGALQAHWSLTAEQAALVAEVAASAADRGLDDYRLARRFFEVTSERERAQFLDVLFAVARAHGKVSVEEIENIRTIALLLKLSPRQFIQAKLKVPRHERDGL